MRMSTSHTSIFDPAYVSGVLGIEVPLNESILHSDEYRRRVIEEQLLMEGFFSDIKKLGGDLKNAALTLKGVMQDPSRISEFVEEVFSAMQEPFEKVTQWIDEIKESILTLSENEKWKKHLETATNWINSLSDKVTGLVDKVKSMSGWKQAIMAAAASVGITYLWDLLKDEGQEATKQIINALLYEFEIYYFQ